MAEAVGLAFGGVALVGLFSTCLEIVDYVASARAHRPSAALSATQVSLLRTRLLQWGDRLSITSPGGEHEILRQRWPEESRIIIDSLLGIKRLFDHSTELIGKHMAGLSDASENGLPATAATLLPRQPSRSGVALSHKTSNRSVWWRGLARILLSVRWALNDKTELDSCINQLEFFVTNLEKVCKRLMDSDDLRTDLHKEHSPEKMTPHNTQEAIRPRSQRVDYLSASLSPQEHRVVARQTDPNQQSRNAPYGTQSEARYILADVYVGTDRSDRSERSKNGQSQTVNDVYEDNTSKATHDAEPALVGPFGTNTSQARPRGEIYRRNKTEGGLIAHIGPVDVNGLSTILQLQKQLLESQAKVSRPK